LVSNRERELNDGSKRGFTLIEMLTVVAVLAVVGALAAPYLGTFMVKNKVASLSNEFTSALQQTRALAISKNTCASLCASTNVQSDNTGTCSNSSGDDFQRGWVIFVNPTCDATQVTPTANGGVITGLRRGESNGYSITPSDAALSMVMFDPRGFANLAAAGNFQIDPPTGSDATLRRTICIDAGGRAAVRKTKTTGTCS
jgi:type IV fimbrial biogenesis protein FimT